MLDSGATHNFIAPTFVTKTKLKQRGINNYEVLLGTGVTVKGMGACREVKFTINNLEFEADFISLELGNANIILGIQWLRTLGKCQVDWETHEMSFVYKGTSVTICGDPTLHNTKMSLKTLMTTSESKESIWGLANLNGQRKETDTRQIPREIELVLDRFEQIFAEPTSLPPVREREHAINLISGAGSISVKPYRYPHCQKEEMEKNGQANVGIWYYPTKS